MQDIDYFGVWVALTVGTRHARTALVSRLPGTREKGKGLYGRSLLLTQFIDLA
jgi:hypothetical protein